jgi:hypothetical protein
MKKLLVLLSILCLFLSDVIADDNVKFSAQVRPRIQLQNKDFNSNLDANSFAELRSRLGVTFVPMNTLTIFLQAQDSRVFGTEPSTISNTANLDIHQAYFLIKKLFELPIELKVGRMELIYGPQRLIGAVGWSNIGRSFDGAVIKLNTEKVELDFIAVAEVENYPANKTAGDFEDKFIFGLYSNIKSFEGYKIQPFIIWQRQVPSDLLSRFTAGFYINGTSGGFFHETEFAYQFGKLTSGQRKLDIAAFMAALNVGYNFNSKAKPVISIGVDYLSGDDGSDAAKTKVFNTLYATNHKYYGFMDFFIDIPANTIGLGLLDIHARFAVSPCEKTTIKLAIHKFNSAKEFTLINGSTSKDFGIETDLTVIHNYNKFVQFVGGASLFSPGDIFKEQRGDDLATWFYLMAVVEIN